MTPSPSHAERETSRAAPTRRSRRSRRGGGIIRRWLLRLGLLGAIIGVSLWRFPTQVDSVSWTTRQFLHRVFYRINVKFAGLDRLRSEDLEVLLPTDQPVWWWIVSLPKIEAQLLTNSMLKSASLKRCEWYSISCFQINIIERQPVGLANLQNTWWLLGDDGAIMGPVSQDGKLRSQLPMIVGAGRFEHTPQILRERLQSALELIKLLNIRGVKNLSFTTDSEILVAFAAEQHRPELLIEISSSERIMEQLGRLSAIEDQLQQRLGEVRRIDLGFESQAVVSFYETASPKADHPVKTDPTKPTEHGVIKARGK